jgi:hypothetical protein
VAKNEADLIAEFKEAFQDELLELELPLGYWRKIHGELYMAGMPDVLCARADRAALAAFKWVRDASEAGLPLAQLLERCITGRQAVDLGLLATLDGPLRSRVVFGMPVEFMMLHGVARSGVVAIGVDYQVARRVRQSLSDLSLTLIAAKSGDADAWQRWWPSQIEGQLRVERGERWRASAITLGTQSYASPQIGGPRG